ncbi:type II toxin-antitoxin system RelE/ParE family toxin [Marinobacter lacisalsi]|uniref:Type II toxin-antitoxin system RelE/ParE family toxin n=1 Tax=Marinobacter lacisalsi TaxID=475979 RepID=A0ABV8QH34_9GAMM
MYKIYASQLFNDWLDGLKDQKAKGKILARMDRAECGNFGDHKALGDHVSEMRLTHGPGYRIYYTQVEDVVFLLLNGGDKSSQKKDIRKAKEMAAELHEAGR